MGYRAELLNFQSGAPIYKQRLFPLQSNLLHSAAGSCTAGAGGNSIPNTQAICYNQPVCACAWIFVLIYTHKGLTDPDIVFFLSRVPY